MHPQRPYRSQKSIISECWSFYRRAFNYLDSNQLQDQPLLFIVDLSGLCMTNQRHSDYPILLPLAVCNLV